MSSFKQMPNPERIEFKRGVTWISIIFLALALGYLQKRGELDYTPLCLGLAVAFCIALFVGFTMGRVGRCPDCGKSMREVYEDTHPKAAEWHLLYCERCDVIWDTLIPKGKD